MLMDCELSALQTSCPLNITQHTHVCTHTHTHTQLSDDTTKNLADICLWINGHGISFTIKDKLRDSCIENQIVVLNTDDA
jgi:hypothetical protein